LRSTLQKLNEKLNKRAYEKVRDTKFTLAKRLERNYSALCRGDEISITELILNAVLFRYDRGLSI
jgi:hypothetical protein